MRQCFYVLFVRPNGWSYEMWPFATSETEAIETANALLEYVERVGISDYLEPNGTNVHGGALLRITAVGDGPRPEVQVRITRPDGTIVEKR